MHKSTGLPINAEKLNGGLAQESAVRQSYATAISFVGAPNKGMSARGHSQDQSITMIQSGGVNLTGRYD
eukprot:CAMPEP_0185598378 /NCGR_PEP_ID=MMETSP0434-20130131/81951_1 /TAXON_ID=626734 ORGANISM="Favella taraikaensis, Strain Fe Narragansett Bay" /NCGR_SAMPLE_ID=MMETSP0434 /ASSEMBLY_ACC=CAM_ASM_000379 /LENGTH=68 /DNA_ID=CAMNT_0028227331 /DNA_START=355 /DNA_END=561 /DNA_ORIENTATION=-